MQQSRATNKGPGTSGTSGTSGTPGTPGTSGTRDKLAGVKRQIRILMWQKRNKVVPVNVFYDQEDELMRAAHTIRNAKKEEEEEEDVLESWCNDNDGNANATECRVCDF